MAQSPENIVFSDIVNSGESKTLFATNSVTLTPGFDAKPNSRFEATISVDNDDINCLPNPSQSTMLRLASINHYNEITLKKPDDEKVSTPIKSIYEINIFPNPNNGNFSVEIGEEVSNDALIEIYSIDRKLVYKTAINSNIQNVVFTNKAGTYIVKVYNHGKLYTDKIILK